MIHREWCQDAQGRVVAQFEEEVAYAIGSGAQARSYVVQRDGFLYQSPMTWYTRKAKWDLSPGFDDTRQHFSRRVIPACLYCHAQEAHPVADTVNRYREPVFGQLAIGCERCHGPGELHVANRRKASEAGDVDLTIVNPRHLAPSLREAVCEQCHLQGETYVARRGQDQADYRPGLPLHEYVSVFVRAPEVADAKKIVSHVEQMHLSACFQKSNGRFGCVSCHDPHGQPPVDQMVAFYRQRCLNCHGTAPQAEGKGVEAPECALPPAQRLVKDARDNCLICHMPRNASSNVTHFAVTDHRVVRHADRPPAAPRRSGVSDVPLANFHRQLLAPDDAESSRDLGIALVDLATRAHDNGAEQVRNFLSRRALPLLDRAAERAPDDVPALVARGFALFAHGRLDDAYKVIADALTLAPNREETLAEAVRVALARGRFDQAEEYCQRLLGINPHFAGHHRNLAFARANRHAWPEALRAAQTAVRLDPFRAEARAILITALLETGDRARAESEFGDLGVIDPDYQRKIRPWFEQRLRQAK